MNNLLQQLTEYTELFPGILVTVISSMIMGKPKRADRRTARELIDKKMANMQANTPKPPPPMPMSEKSNLPTPATVPISETES